MNSHLIVFCRETNIGISTLPGCWCHPLPSRVWIFFKSNSSKTWQNLVAISLSSVSVLLIKIIFTNYSDCEVHFVWHTHKKCSNLYGISSIFIVKEQTKISILKDYGAVFCVFSGRETHFLSNSCDII